MKVNRIDLDLTAWFGLQTLHDLLLSLGCLTV